MRASKKRGITLQTCRNCGTAFSTKITECPNCHHDTSRVLTEICPHCGVELSSTLYTFPLYVCPNCHKPFKIYGNKIDEGTGRGHHGAACDICPVCHGTPDWCPYLD